MVNIVLLTIAGATFLNSVSIISLAVYARKKEKKNRKFILCYNRNGLSFLRVRRTLLDGKVVKEEESFDISVEEIKEINIDEER